MKNSPSIQTKILELLRTSAPLSLRELHNLIRPSDSAVAFSTIFRHVRSLLAEGRVVRVDWRERGGRYEAASLPHHHHISCRVCHKVVDLTDAVLPFALQSIEAATGFTVEQHTIELEGVCADCQTA